jgi:hypothetical protein
MTTKGALHLSDNYTGSNLLLFFPAKYNLEPARKSKNKQEKVDKLTVDRPCPRDKSEAHEFDILDTSNRMV